MKYTKFYISFFTIIFFCSILIPSAYSHGGKKHGENEFTAFAAIQKATMLYGKLIENGKLSETWELDIVNVSVTTRMKQDDKEFVVSFEKTDGSPNKVYIYFNSTGEYSGSNFTGK